MHIALAVWKARSLLEQASDELRPSMEHDVDPDLIAHLHRAEAAVTAALAELGQRTASTV